MAQRRALPDIDTSGPDVYESDDLGAAGAAGPSAVLQSAAAANTLRHFLTVDEPVHAPFGGSSGRGGAGGADDAAAAASESPTMPPAGARGGARGDAEDATDDTDAMDAGDRVVTRRQPGVATAQQQFEQRLAAQDFSGRIGQARGWKTALDHGGGSGLASARRGGAGRDDDPLVRLAALMDATERLEHDLQKQPLAPDVGPGDPASAASAAATADAVAALQQRLNQLVSAAQDRQLNQVQQSLASSQHQRQSLIAQMSDLLAADTRPSTATAAATVSAPPSSSSTAVATARDGASGVTYEVHLARGGIDRWDAARLIAVESRLHHLEQVIGLHLLQDGLGCIGVGTGGAGAKDDAAAAAAARLRARDLTHTIQRGGSLVGVLDQIEAELGLLTNPRALEQVTVRAKAAAAELERLADRRKRHQQDRVYGEMELLGASPVQPQAGAATSAAASSTPATAPPATTATDTLMSAEAAVKIDKAYTLLQRVDHVAGVVPSLVARLHSLERLHNEAGVFAESLGQLQAVAAEGDAADAALQTTLETLRSSMAENDRRTRENMALLEQRLEKLRQHVDPS